MNKAIGYLKDLAGKGLDVITMKKVMIAFGGILLLKYVGMPQAELVETTKTLVYGVLALYGVTDVASQIGWKK